MERIASMADKQPRKSLTVRGRFWAGHLHRWQQSGLSQTQYCRQQQLSAPAFGWWKRQLATAQARGHPATTQRQARAQDGSFVELTRAGGGIPALVGEVVYEMVLPGHRQLRLGRHFELDQVRQLLQVLEGGC
jgi:hypothetical protein